MNTEEAIKSRDNAKLKLARAVRDGREPGLMFIEGVRLVEEAKRSGCKFRFVLISSNFRAHLDNSPDHFRVDAAVLDSIVDTENSQGIVAIAERPASVATSIPQGLIVLLHRVNNPSNLGAVVRTAEAAGAAGLITTTSSADAFSPKALRASMGSAFRLPIIEGLDYFEGIRWARERNMVATAADISGTASYTDIDWTIPRLVVFGSEAHGLDERELAEIDKKIVIPMENEVESLNLAVSSGVILFEAKRQRGPA